MTRQTWIRELDQVAPDDARRVGAKAWRLGRLLQAGFPVAAGFCLSTAACAAGSAAIRPELLAAYRRLGGGPVAVRSSAVEEDGELASYAGIYCSELPVDGAAALLAAVERCLASWHADDARAYRARLGHRGDFSLAILVQRLVPASAAGVAYTCDPLRPRCRRVHVNAVWGLAEPLAAGRVGADSFVVSRRGRLLASTIVDKKTELTAAGPGPVPAERAHRPCLSRAEIRQVAALALRAEAYFGAPQDVEFAFAADGLRLLQSRPVVIPEAPPLSPLDCYLDRERRRLARRFATLRRRGLLSGREGILSNGNVGELLTSPTPFSFGLFRRLFAGAAGAVVAGRRRLGYRFPGRAACGLYEMVAGQVYFNVEIDALTFDYGASPAVDYYLEQIIADPGLANYPEVRLYRQHYDAATARECFGADGAAAALAKATAFHRAMAAAGTALLAHPGPSRPAAATAGGPSAASPAALADAIAARISRLRRGPCVDFVVAARLGFYFAARVRERLLGWLGDGADRLCAALLSGLPGSLVTDQALALERLLAGKLSREDFLAAYGHSADNELELSEPRLRETPARLDAMLRDLAASGRSPGTEFAAQQAQRRAAEGALARRLAAAGHAAGEVAALFDDLHLAQRLLPLRESLKYRYTASYAEIRRQLLELAGRLGWEPQLIFHLRPEELARAASDPTGWRPLAERRRGERSLAREAARRRLLPDVIFSSRLAAIGQPPSAGGDAWQGSGLAAGQVRGIARIIDGEPCAGHGDFSGDEILILRSANLGLAPLFRLVAGIVVEVGGLLAHSACQAREAGIPAVQLAGATTLIGDGSRLLIDGTTGRVCLLPPENLTASDDPDHDLALAAL